MIAARYRRRARLPKNRPLPLHKHAFVIAITLVAFAPWQGAFGQHKHVHQTNAEDIRAIEKVLETYTTSVTNGDKATFEAVLLNEAIPFSSTDELAAPGAIERNIDTRRYPQFRKAVFESGGRYTQRFDNVQIKQDGALAQVSLDFITKETKSGSGACGWKTLQLLKSQGRWKIASEFYTVRALPTQ